MIDRDRLIDDIRDIIGKSGFYSTDQCDIRSTSFDVIARRDDMLLIIKVLLNVDAISRENAKEIKTLSKLLNGTALLIGERSCFGKLEGGVLYIRHGVTMLSRETLYEYFIEGVPPFIYAAPGGLCTRINSKVLREFREKNSISLGEFADRIGVSRKAIQLYEDGMGATIEVATKIEEVVREDVILPLNPLSRAEGSEDWYDGTSLENENICSLERSVFTQLHQLGYMVIPIAKCPFNALTKNEKCVIITGIGKYNKDLIKKAHIIKSISKITEKEAVFFVEKIKHDSIGGAPIIGINELKKIREPEKILELIQERKVD
ncbi:MAG: transcriptional regulator [Thermoplasmata archaeon]